MEPVLVTSNYRNMSRSLIIGQHNIIVRDRHTNSVHEPKIEDQPLPFRQLNGDPTEQPRAKIENKENSKNDNHWPGGHPHQIRDGPFRKPQPVI